MAAWLSCAGQHGQQPLGQQGQVDLQPVPAEALWVPLVGRRIWMAMALAVASRLWLGGTISPHREWRPNAADIRPSAHFDQLSPWQRNHG